MYKYLLWTLKIGALINVYFLWQTINSPIAFIDPYLLVPAQILFFVSTYRCLFPVSYSKGVVLHDTFISSIFITRFLVTFVEVAYIYQFSYVLRIINADQIPFVDLLSWLMVLQVVVSQCFVWSAILLQREIYYLYEELGWAIIFIFNTTSSAILYLHLDNHDRYETLLQISLVFGLLYLPWQIFHLKKIITRAKTLDTTKSDITWELIFKGLKNSIYSRNKTSRPEAWGGIVGMTWMVSYWVTLIPVWIYFIIYTFSLY